MKIKISTLLKSFIITSLLLATNVRSLAKAQLNSSIFVLISSDQSYDLLKVSSNNQVEMVVSIPRASAESFAAFVPPEEIKAAQDYLAQVNTGTNFADFSSTKLNVTVQTLSIAPNHGQIILNVLYQTCLRYPRYTCFGVSKLLLISSSAKTSVPLWSLGLHTKQYVPQVCHGQPVEDMAIHDVRWTPDSQAIIISLLGDKYCFGENTNLPLLIVPLVNPSRGLNLGEAIAWNITNDSRSLDTIVRRCFPSSGCADTLDIIQFDLPALQISHRSYPLDSKRLVIPSSMANLNGTVLAYVANTADQGASIDFMLFDENNQPHFAYSAPIVYGNINMSPDGKTVLLEDKDGLLSQIELTGGVPMARLLSQVPVSSWQWGQGKTLLVQFKNETNYAIIDQQGNVLKSIDLAKQVAAFNPNAKIEALGR